MSKHYPHRDRTSDGQPRDGKRTHRAKSTTITRKQQRRAKHQLREGGR